MVKRVVLAVLLFGMLAGLGASVGCGGAPPVATAADAARVHIELAELERGRALLVSRCGSCHRTPLPADRRASEWPGKVGEMAERAHLDVTQRRLIEQYLVTMTTR